MKIQGKTLLVCILIPLAIGGLSAFVTRSDHVVHLLFQYAMVFVCLFMAYFIMAADSVYNQIILSDIQTSRLSDDSLSIMGHICRLS